MAYVISGLPAEAFRQWHAWDDDALAAHGIRRVRADAETGFPCRVSLRDAAIGETLLLLPFEHHPTMSPYRASGPIYAREHAGDTAVFRDRVPPFLGHRRLSLRAYSADGWMRAADVVAGAQFESAIEGLFARRDIAYVHAHNAAPGCYLCRVDRS